MQYGSVISGMFRYLAFLYFLHGNKISVSMTCDGTMQKVVVNSIGIPVTTGFSVKYFWNKRFTTLGTCIGASMTLRKSTILDVI